MKSLIAGPLLVLCSVGLCAQGTVPPKKTPTPPAKAAHKPILKPATVSGFVFALTSGGDIKPARMAKVYLLYSRPAERPASELVEQSRNGQSAADVFRREVLDGEDKEKTWEEDKPYLKDLTKCHAMLTNVYQGAIVETLHWGDDRKTQFVFGETDEDGTFEITIPPQDMKDVTFEPTPRDDTAFAPGVYLIVVIGSAGYNDAVWADEVTVKPGETVKVKLSAPTKACLKSESE